MTPALVGVVAHAGVLIEIGCAFAVSMEEYDERHLAEGVVAGGGVEQVGSLDSSDAHRLDGGYALLGGTDAIAGARAGGVNAAVSAVIGTLRGTGKRWFSAAAVLAAARITAG